MATAWLQHGYSMATAWLQQRWDGVPAASMRMTSGVMPAASSCRLRDEFSWLARTRKLSSRFTSASLSARACGKDSVHRERKTKTGLKSRGFAREPCYALVSTHVIQPPLLRPHAPPSPSSTPSTIQKPNPSLYRSENCNIHNINKQRQQRLVRASRHAPAPAQPRAASPPCSGTWRGRRHCRTEQP
jgi:hypothetical protein